MTRKLTALLQSINHWKENLENAINGARYCRDGYECAVCNLYRPCAVKQDCILQIYQMYCDDRGPWSYTDTYAEEATWNMLECLMLVYLSEGGDPKLI